MDASPARFAHHAIYGLQPQTASSPFPPARGRSLPLPDHSKRPAFEGERGRFGASGLSPGSEVRLDLFATPSVNVHNLRNPAGWSRREADVEIGPSGASRPLTS